MEPYSTKEGVLLDLYYISYMSQVQTDYLLISNSPIQLTLSVACWNIPVFLSYSVKGTRTLTSVIINDLRFIHRKEFSSTTMGMLLVDRDASGTRRKHKNICTFFWNLKESNNLITIFFYNRVFN